MSNNGSNPQGRGQPPRGPPPQQPRPRGERPAGLPQGQPQGQPRPGPPQPRPGPPAARPPPPGARPAPPSARPPPPGAARPPPPGAARPPPPGAARPPPPGATRPPPPGARPPPPGVRPAPPATRPAPPSAQSTTSPQSVMTGRGRGGTAGQPQAREPGDMGAKPKVRPETMARGRSAAPPMAAPSEAMETMSLRSDNGSDKGDSRKERGFGRGTRTLHSSVRRPHSELVETKPIELKSKMGSSGTKVDLLSNHFRVLEKPGFNIYLYRVDFEPEEDDTRQRKWLVRNVAKSLPVHLFEGTMLFTTKPLDFERLSTTNSRSGEVATILFKAAGTVGKESPNFNQVLNIVMRKCMDGLNLAQFKRNYFDPQAKETLQQWKLEIWPGYLTSIRLHEEHLLLNVDTMFKVLRTDTCYSVMRKLNFDKVKVERELLGNIVMTRYNNLTYKIEKILWDMRVDSKFDRKGEPTTYFEYFQKRWHLPVHDKNQPLLDCSRRDRMRRIIGQTPQEDKVHLIPELCTPTGLESTMLNNFKLKADLNLVMKPPPKTKLDSIRKFITRLRNEKKCKQELEDWNLDYAIELEKVIARVLNPIPLDHGAGQWTYTSDRPEWQSFGRFKLFQAAAPLNRWAVVLNRNSKGIWDKFFGLLSNSGRNMGFPMQKPIEILLNRTSALDYSTSIGKLITDNRDLQMVVALYDGKKSDVYPAIKKVCCLEMPTQSQVLTERVISKEKGLESVANKVALQMATKMGSIPWTLKIPLKALMVCGYDVFHDTTRGKMSVGAFVCSLDNTHNRFHSMPLVHENNKELSTKLGQAIESGLAWYKNKAGFYPDKIVFYRDGVGEGDFHEVLETEVKHMRAAIEKVSPTTKFTFIIVSKRINTKLFKPVGDRVLNPSAGTVVDSVVTLPNRYDFYLIPQCTRFGTITPSGFNIVFDNSGLLPDHLQKLTYMLCHLYYNWQGTVKVPCLVQYAHKLAALVGETLTTPPTKNPEFHNSLYYL